MVRRVVVHVTGEGQGELFGISDSRPATTGGPGQAEAGLAVSARRAAEEGQLIEQDAALLSAAFIAARALDRADRMDKPAYAVAALLTPYRETLNNLRLPAALDPVPAAGPAKQSDGAPDWMHEQFGRPS